MAKHIVHLHSSEEDKVPGANQLSAGEIAVNNYAGKECLYIKNSENDIIRIPSDNIVENKLNKVTSVTSESTDTQYVSAKCLYDFVEQIYGTDITNPSIGYYKDLSKYDIYGVPQDTRETANCYVISRTGLYCFPLVYGNGIKHYPESSQYHNEHDFNTRAYSLSQVGTYQTQFTNYLGNSIVSPYIESDTEVIINSVEILMADEENVISDLSITSSVPTGESCNFIKFHVDRIPFTGANVIIGIKDAERNIIWSWHIWLWRENLATISITNYSGNTYNFLPVNLGSKYDDTTIYDTEPKRHIKSWYYQWGRKDPMLLPESYNSNTDHAYYGTTSFSIEPCAASVAESIKNPCTFYKSDSNYNYNWVQLNYYYNFWDATCSSEGATEKVIVKTIYDPCPRDFTVPNARVFTGFTSTGGNTSTAEQFNVIGSFAKGWYFKKNENDSSGAFFPASGYRSSSSGGLTNVGVFGDYWSAGVYSAASAYYLHFSSGYVSPLYNYSRAYAFPVRPVKGGGA